MGVWIETSNTSKWLATALVTPCMGVWIETVFLCPLYCALVSHPVWVCGLKPLQFALLSSSSCHTLYGCVD